MRERERERDSRKRERDRERERERAIVKRESERWSRERESELVERERERERAMVERARDGRETLWRSTLFERLICAVARTSCLVSAVLIISGPGEPMGALSPSLRTIKDTEPRLGGQASV